MLYHTTWASPLGPMSLLADEEALLGIYFEGQAYFERGLAGEERLEATTPVLAAAMSWLAAYFSGQCPGKADFPLAPRGTAFQQRVWQALAAIPYGETVTYGQLAQQLDCQSAQAIGGAVGRNPLSILVPCHRVLGSQGQLTGYAGGLDKKIFLLTHEGVNLDSQPPGHYHKE